MVQGYILDSHADGSITVSSWIEGAPEVSFWRGTKDPSGKHIPVGVFRCSACGFLESYARKEFGAR
jgi:hypothetical protein